MRTLNYDFLSNIISADVFAALTEYCYMDRLSGGDEDGKHNLHYSDEVISELIDFANYDSTATKRQINEAISAIRKWQKQDESAMIDCD